MTLGHLSLYGVLCVEESVQANKRRKLMSHNVVPPLKGPAPPADEVMTLWKRLKRLGTLLSTQTEEGLNADGTSKRLTTVRRTVRR
jgi:hypothetical protein